jgi:hypothetical protein
VTVTVNEVYEAVNDREAVMDFLDAHPDAEFPANDPCGCIFHAYLAKRFGIDALIYYDEITIVLSQDSDYVTISGSFASDVQREWTRMTALKYGDEVRDGTMYTDDGDPIVLTGKEALDVVERMDYETRR